jgi:CRISPR-associated protein Csb3
MTELQLRGDLRTALSHMTMIGLAAILEDAGVRDVRVAWTRELDARPLVWTDGVDLDAAAEIVRDHARRCAAANSWVAASIDLGDGPVGAMSPRIKKPADPRAWQLLTDFRAGLIDSLTDARSRLDLRFVGALGAPSYWHFATAWGGSARRDPRPDWGASKWEMKTRNRGEEFVRNRLHPMAESVASRDATSIRQGLDGTAPPLDLTGKGKYDSRTATGLASPGPTDDAAAWCGLWAISQFPVIPLVSAQSRTAGHLRVPGAARSRGWFYLPMAHVPMTMPRLRSVILSSELERVVRKRVADDRHAPTDLEAEAARDWLRDRHVSGVAYFPVLASDNVNAPELRALDGTVIPLEAGPDDRPL